MKEYLCKCNKCDTILFDENPDVDSITIDVTAIEKPIDRMVQLRDDSEWYWACPNCFTDNYLTDLIN